MFDVLQFSLVILNVRNITEKVTITRTYCNIKAARRCASGSEL